MLFYVICTAIALFAIAIFVVIVLVITALVEGEEFRKEVISIRHSFDAIEKNTENTPNVIYEHCDIARKSLNASILFTRLDNLAQKMAHNYYNELISINIRLDEKVTSVYYNENSLKFLVKVLDFSR